MTSKRSSDNPPRKAEPRSPKMTEIDNVGSEQAEADALDPDAAAAKASVHEAIGKLIGDDAERRRGTADKKASGISPQKPRKPQSP